MRVVAPSCLLVVLALAAACGDDGAATATDATSAADTGAATDAAGSDATADAATPSDTATSPADAASDASASDADTSSPAEPTPVCVAIRGNGELITAHFAALSRIAELFGPFDGVAGGSSGSISAFLTESMHMHPGLATCGETACSRAEAGARLGLLYKSLFGYIEAMGDTDEAVAVAQILGVIELAKSKGIGELVSAERLSEAWSALTSLLTSDEVADLVNPEVLTFLQAPVSLTAHVKDVWEAFTTFGNFKADSAKIFLRPGLVNFAGLAQKIGRIGSFYAGYGAFDATAWEAFFTACATPGVGKPWPEVAALSSDGKTCRERFRAILDPWRTAFIPTETDTNVPNRVSDRVGAHLRTLVVTSVLTNQAAADFTTAREAYFGDESWTFAPSFGDVRVGYWGAAVDTSGAVGNPRGYPDLKTSKAMTLGQTTWLEALSLSPAEPGLSRAQERSGGQVSAGGWPDLAPVLALKNAGCERVIYLTRRGGDSVFGQQIAGLLGMTTEQQHALYDLANPDSSLNLSLSEAAGVWCTDWNAFGATDLAGIIADATTAPLEVHDPTLTSLAPYGGRTTRANLPGCTPGVVPPPTP